MAKMKHLLVGALGAALALGPVLAPTALGDGAFAVGSTGNVTRDGIAFGGAYNFPSREIAMQKALEACRGWKAAPKAASLCQVVATFKRECYATANDPKAGTPGTGWAVAQDKARAEARAIANCKATAGPDRQNACVLELSYCDTTN